MSRKPFRLAPFVLAVGAVLAWSGCNLAPRYARPAVDTPPAFKEAGAAPASAGIAWNPAQPGDSGGRGRWWQIYGDAQLSALEDQVQVSNQNVQAAEASYRAARAAASIARASLFPLVGLEPTITRSRSSQSVLPPSASAGQITNQYVMPAEASYTIDFWGRVRNNVRAADYSAQASAADAATAVLSMQAELAQDYFQLRALDTENQILSDTVASYRRALHDTDTLFQNGIDSQEDVARAQNQLDVATAQATDLSAARSSFEHAIAVLIGKAPASFALAPAPLNAQAPAAPPGLPSELLERRPDIAAAERRVAVANAQIGVARAAYFPNFTLAATGGFSSSHFSQWFDWPSRIWSVGPQASMLVFAGGALSAATDQAHAEFDQAAANYRQTVLSAFQSVEDNLANLRILEQEAAEQQTAVASSRHVLDLATTRFQTGIDSYLNVVTAQTALLASQEAAVQVDLRRMLSSVSLIMALGGGWTAAQLPG
ncbi:MAG TPA: efflux transporter outer membrane subunit [Opitutaceae bacterium]|jgi:NodT family efflux transporter outer membrane factor (OMF) lipoprotein|nr:efflux transporter outer membrane subunit [Opitutaceae bacterium]